tara:strand:+ start:242 stop:1219 length:978 start_codon:yes stop_codon:yes gene_type:complete
MLNIAIRVANYNNSGRGHISRCANIRKFLGKRVIWFLDKPSCFLKNQFPDDIYYIEKIENSISNLKTRIKKDLIGLILVDSYKIKSPILNSLNNTIPVAVILDNFKKINVDIIISVNPTEHRSYRGKENLLGAKYAPVLYNKTNKCYKKNKILISMGLIDKAEVTLKAIKALKRLYKKKLIYHNTIITIGKDSPIIRNIEKEIYEYKKYFKLFIDEKNISDIYQQTLFAVGAPGVSQLERLLFGVPTILVHQNNLHKNIIKDWVEKECAIMASSRISSIENKILKIYNGKKIRTKMIKNGKKHVDGLGSKRISRKLTQYLENNGR